MAVKKKENKAVDENKDMEVIDNGLQNEIGEEIGEEKAHEEEIVNVKVDTTIKVDTSDKVVKMVKIKPNCNFRFYYGTTWYELQEGVETNVPKEVKERLNNAGKLSAI